ncbi:MAG: putative toxin-antitoxin system toxin component, PIN family [Candidatus Methylacidiphilales bacterium]
MRVFLDANVLFSASKSDGALRLFLSDLQAAGHELIADAYVVEEARRNLERKYPNSLRDFEHLLRRVTIPPNLCPSLKQEILPGLAEKDRPVLAAAIAHRCQTLLTGDKTHFGPFYGQTVEGMTIHSPATLATYAHEGTDL